MARIGIKLADGSFYPVLEDETRQRKRMVLTVARDDQASAQIDIIREDGELNQYVGCLVLEGLSPDTASELEFTIGIDGEGNVDAQVSDSDGTQYQSLAVNLATLDVGESYSLPDEEDAFGEIGGVDDLQEVDLPDLDEPALDIPDVAAPDADTTGFDSAEFDAGDFDAEAMPDLPGDDLSGDDLGDAFAAADGPAPSAVGDDGPVSMDTFLDDELNDDDEEPEEAPRPFSALTLAAVLLIGLSLVALGAFAMFRWLQTDALPDLRAATLLPVVVPRLRRGAALRGARSCAAPVVSRH